MSKRYKIAHKLKKVLVPVCPKCDKPLSGNNSQFTPYECYDCHLIYRYSTSNGDYYTAESDGYDDIRKVLS